jgi:hypothetical protein
MASAQLSKCSYQAGSGFLKILINSSEKFTVFIANISLVSKENLCNVRY